MKLSGQEYTEKELLFAMAVDRLSILVWQRTEAGSKGKNPPESIYNKMVGAKKEEKTESFMTPEEFERKRMEIIERR